MHRSLWMGHWLDIAVQVGYIGHRGSLGHFWDIGRWLPGPSGPKSTPGDNTDEILRKAVAGTCGSKVRSGTKGGNISGDIASRISSWTLSTSSTTPCEWRVRGMAKMITEKFLSDFRVSAAFISRDQKYFWRYGGI